MLLPNPSTRTYTGACRAAHYGYIDKKLLVLKKPLTAMKYTVAQKTLLLRFQTAAAAACVDLYKCGDKKVQADDMEVLQCEADAALSL